MDNIRTGLLLVSTVLLAACGQQPIEEKLVENIVAEVAEHKIYLSQLNVAAERSLGRSYSALDEKTQQRLLGSLISASAMEQLALADMTEDDLSQLDHQVTAYKQEMLVKRYLKDNAIPQPVSQQQVEEYYDSHPHEFGGGAIFDITSMQCDTTAASTLEKCALLLKKSNLSAWRQEQLSFVKHQRRTLNSLVEADSSLVKLAQKTGEGQFSTVKSNKLSMTRLYVHKIKTLAPKPLSSVSRSIRNRLAPQQLKKAIRVASEKARSSVVIKRM